MRWTITGEDGASSRRTARSPPCMAGTGIRRYRRGLPCYAAGLSGQSRVSFRAPRTLDRSGRLDEERRPLGAVVVVLPSPSAAVGAKGPAGPRGASPDDD